MLSGITPRPATTQPPGNRHSPITLPALPTQPMALGHLLITRLV